MSYTFLIVGAIIFAIYTWFTLWIIFSQNKKQREEDYPSVADDVDGDGMSDFTRFGNYKRKNTN